YAAEREARAAAAVAGVPEQEPDEELVVAAEGVEGEPEEDGAVDQDELLRRLEEFKREMFTNE
ncbi:MAG: hypothetical protein ABR975_12565, partial [Vulcanimicrobiaceae bacterium]